MAKPLPRQQSLAWAHGVVTLQSLGGMIGPSSFVLPVGRQVSPLHIAPWFAEAMPPGLPGVLHQLRGEWPCVPFGVDAERNLPTKWQPQGVGFDGAEIPHGHGSNADWQFDTAPDAIAMRCVYPETHPIKSLHREVRPDPVAAALDITLRVQARRACRLPIGLHPTFRLPSDGFAQLIPPSFNEGRVFPQPVEKTSLLAPDAVFSSLDAVPLADGGSLSLTQLPFATKNEELVQLCGVKGDFVLRYPGEDFQMRLSWNSDHFPSVLLWVSNQGRDYAPWNGRHLALGIEPVCSAFDLGPALSSGPNPIADAGTPTATEFQTGQDFITHYRIAVEPLGAN